MQTCIVACSSLAFAGGFGCYLLSMDHQTFENLGDIAGNRAEVTPSTVFLICSVLLSVILLMLYFMLSSSVSTC